MSGTTPRRSGPGGGALTKKAPRVALTRRALFVFIPTNSNCQISVNLRKKEIEKKIKKNFSPHSHFLSVCSFIWFCLFFLFDVGPICPFIPLFSPF